MRRYRQHCVSCPPSEWEAIRNLADAAGMKTSPYILSRVLGGGSRMTLSAEEQRNLHDGVNRMVRICEDLLRPLPGSGVTLGEAVSFLFLERQEARKAATMTRTMAEPQSTARDRGSRLVQQELPGLTGDGSP